jgi:Glycosyltransferase
MNKNVLYLSYDGLTDPLGQSQVLPYLIGLTYQGYKFTILSFEKKERLKREGSVIKELVTSAGIRWVPLSFTTEPPVFSKMYDRYRLKKLAFALYKRFNFDLIHCRSYVAAEVGLKLKQEFKVPFLFDMRGFWADEKVDNGQWSLNNPIFKRIYKHYKNKEKQFLLQANGIVSLTYAAKEYLIQQPLYSKLKIDVIPCCADLDHFNYNKINQSSVLELKKKLNIPEEKKVLCYLGSVGGWYMVSEMLHFFKLLNRNNNYIFLILTKEDPSLVEAEAKKVGINTYDLRITYSPRNELPLYLSLCTSSIFLIRNSFSKIASSPTKLGELMGMGIPVICNSIGDTEYIIKKTRAGLLLNAFDDVTISNQLLNMEILESMSKDEIRKGAFEFFDLQSGIIKYRELYNRIFDHA